MQLCAQAMCLEEMLNTVITECAIYSGKTKHRRQVPLTDDLRRLTVDTARRLHEFINAGVTPPAVYKHETCDRCSLAGICMPKKCTGRSPVGRYLNRMFREEEALGNIAEVAIGCNEKAVVTGNVLEDEKAGFHWAYGRSDHLGGEVGPSCFSAPERVCHQDIVYARGNPIVCRNVMFCSGSFVSVAAASSLPGTTFPEKSAVPAVCRVPPTCPISSRGTSFVPPCLGLPLAI